MSNQISVYLDPAAMPNQSQPQATFDANMGQFFANLPAFGSQFNAGASNVNASLNGVGLGIPYTIDLSSTADSDPGNGNIRFGSATQNAALVLRLDLVSTNTADYTAVLDTFNTSTSSIKGRIALVKQGDAKTFLTFDVSGVTTVSGYRNVTVTPVASSSANPFVQGDAVLLYFQRTGDMGATGPVNPIYHAKFAEQYASGTGGGSTGTGTAMRLLNTVVDNNIPGASMTSSIITLPAGTYDFRGRAGATATTNGLNKVSLLNITDSITYPGSGRALGVGSTADNIDSVVSGRFVIGASKTFKLQCYFGSTSTTFGAAIGSGAPEIYSEIEFWKVA